MKYVFFIFLLITFYHAEAQCELKYEVQSEPTIASKQGKIQLKLNSSDLSGAVSITLYDIMDESVPVIQEKRVLSSQAKNPVVFDNLKATTYIIKVSWRNCTKTIGGLEGIKIDQK